MNTNLILHILGALVAAGIVLIEARSAGRALYFRMNDHQEGDEHERNHC